MNFINTQDVSHQQSSIVRRAARAGTLAAPAARNLRRTPAQRRAAAIAYAAALEVLG